MTQHLGAIIVSSLLLLMIISTLLIRSRSKRTNLKEMTEMERKLSRQNAKNLKSHYIEPGTTGELYIDSRTLHRKRDREQEEVKV